MRHLILAFALLCGLGGMLSVHSAQAMSIQLNPVDADSIKPYLDDNYNSSQYIYSYYANEAKNKHTAYMKFDLSSIPDTATITDITLKMSSYLIVFLNGNQASVYRGDNDNWSSKSQDLYPGTDELLGDPLTIASQFTYYTWILHTEAVDWSEDLSDNTLTLGINTPGYIDWFAIDELNPTRKPLLTIDYTDTPPTIGDANGDHLVDGVDYTIWADHFLLTTSLGAAEGDFTGDGKIDGADYTIWADNFAPALLSVAAVPEPSTLLLAVIGSAVLGSALTAQVRRRRM